MLKQLFAASALLGLAGCSAIQTMQEVSANAEQAQHSGSADLQQFKQLAGDRARSAAQSVSTPWIAGRAQPLAREVTLPAALRANVNTTLIFEDTEVDLPTLAERIQMATGIPTTVEPDALLPRTAFLPRLALEQNQQTLAVQHQAQMVDTLVPALTAASAFPQLNGPMLPQGTTRITRNSLPGSAPLATLLDAAALRLGVYWAFDESVGALRFYRTQTKSFNVRALAVEAEDALNREQSANTNGSATPATTITDEKKSRQMQAAVMKLEQFLTRAGVVKSADAASNTVVVTDTREALQRVSTYLESENRAMTRRVRMVFEEITVQRDQTTQAGVDWRILFDSLGRANTATGTGAGTLLDGARAAGSVGATVGSGPFAGSRLIVSALSEMGTVVRHNSIPLLAANRRAARYTVRETFSYVKDLQQTPSTSDITAPTVTVTQEEKTVGTFLTVVPDAQEDGQILLTVAWDDTRLIGPLKKEEFGSRDFPSFVQQHRTGGQGVVQQVELRPGQPVVIGGYEQSTGNSTRRRLDDKAPMILGGSDAGQQQYLLTVLIVTAIPEEGF